MLGAEVQGGASPHDADAAGPTPDLNVHRFKGRKIRKTNLREKTFLERHNDKNIN